MQPIETNVSSGAIHAANTLSALKKENPAAGDAADADAPFSGVWKEAMNNLEGLEEQASSAVEGLVSGRGVDVHQAMIATQKSDLAFEMALAVRGKMVSAYQSLMGVQF